MQTELSTTRPPLLLSEDEAEALYALALSLRDRSALAAEMLLSEIDRADTVTRAELPSDVVSMMSCVTFLDEGSGEEHSVELVYPRQAEDHPQRISVMTPIGAALIGMRKGSAINWPNRAGAHRCLRILEVRQPGDRP